MGQSQDDWEVLWCHPGFYLTAERLRSHLPPWCRMRLVDPSVPLRDQVATAKVLVPAAARITPDILDAAKELRLISQAGTGYDSIDVAACRARNVPVCRCPGLNAQSVAEAAFGALLAMTKKFSEQVQAFKETKPGVVVGVQLAGRTMGIIGMGNIGEAMTKMAEGMSMRVISTRSSSSRAELEHLLRESDVVSLSCPLNDATRGLIGREELAMMKRGSYLLNFARGAIIDRQALIDTLEGEDNPLAGVALDVHWEPIWDPTRPPYNHPLVLALPHNGFATTEVFDGFSDVIVQNICACKKNAPLQHQL